MKIRVLKALPGYVVAQVASTKIPLEGTGFVLRQPGLREGEYTILPTQDGKYYVEGQECFSRATSVWRHFYSEGYIEILEGEFPKPVC